MRAMVAKDRASELAERMRQLLERRGYHAEEVGAVALGAECVQVELLAAASAADLSAALSRSDAWVSVHLVVRNGRIAVSASTRRGEEVLVYEFVGTQEASWGLRKLSLTMPTHMRRYLQQRLLAHGWLVDHQSSMVVDRRSGHIHVCPTEASVFELAAVHPLVPAQRAEWSLHWHADAR